MCGHALIIFHYFSYVVHTKKYSRDRSNHNVLIMSCHVMFFFPSVIRRAYELQKNVSGKFLDSNILKDMCEKGKEISKKKHFLISFEFMNISLLATNYTVVLNTSPVRVVILTPNPNSTNQASDHGGFSARSAPDCLYIYGSFF